MDAIRAPLPSRAYSSPEIHKLEIDTLYRGRWLFVGPASAYRSTNTAAPVDIAGLDLLITCDEANDLHGFFNVCAHRACHLVTEPATVKRIACPYHAWVYTLDGNLVSARSFGGDGSTTIPTSDPQVTGLKPVSLEVWHDLLFINTAPSPRPLRDTLAPVIERIGWLQLDQMQYHSSLEYHFEANWKFIVENFLESYHVPFLHHTLDGYSPATGRYQFQLPGNISGIGTRPYGAAQINNRCLPTWQPTGGRDYPADFAEYYAVLPNLLLGVMPDHLFAWSLDPVAPEKAIEKLHFFFVGPQSTTPDLAEHIQLTLDRWMQVNDEDWTIVQNMHRGARSESFKRALLSPVMERNIIRFQQHIIDLIPAAAHDHTPWTENGNGHH
ncbi:aromatic ring-hydroxylating dioxygenase subunit alpha [Tsukamurella sp. 8F]|uniref:aromatic ring-hydroxylating oxygenase subunit alpha n=1 Tax=unclassified Tsukamurella TaxID=2633480 RepID=UPI0023B94F5C|nr:MULTISPECIES: aromatic ring-hydroxylating dioxygenase subunit alpha [unclassified Tsukamurella]MDF0528655.1 aromatic ring-hydroxylating dioxygenase subunit alpha [Tsukamurella sp. 8J]MDF0585617.1 aromatic ring-hydroxylating dioxygenase subunit alpha [Tsukamurella sp. 8F]